jgi:hypothetical protein
VSDLAVKGQDVLDQGIKPGPYVGQILKELFNEVLDGNIANDRTALMFMLKHITSYGTPPVKHKVVEGSKNFQAEQKELDKDCDGQLCAELGLEGFVCTKCEYYDGVK